VVAVSGWRLGIQETKRGVAARGPEPGHEGVRTRGQERQSAKVQIGAELLCKGANRSGAPVQRCKGGIQEYRVWSIEYRGMPRFGWRVAASGGRWLEDFREVGSGPRHDIAAFLRPQPRQRRIQVTRDEVRPHCAADDRAGHPYHEATGFFSGLKLAILDYDMTQDRGYPSRRGLGSSDPRLFFTQLRWSCAHGGPQEPD
jgi:hypothetical protein